jgi:hypothetical protein
MQDSTTKTLGLSLVQKDVSLEGYITQPPRESGSFGNKDLP